MRNLTNELNGAWEEPGIIGTRVEIKGKNITIFWRNEAVLSTSFNKLKKDNDIELLLKNDELKYSDGHVYGHVKSMILSDGKLAFIKNFPITGNDTEILSKTENSKYGNYEICDDILKELSGVWKDQKGFLEVKIKKNVFTYNGIQTKIHVLKSKSSKGLYLIVDEDPSKYNFEGYTRFEYNGSTLTTNMIIFDADPFVIVLDKK